MIKLLTQTVHLFSRQPGRVIQSALPGLIVFCLSQWMLIRATWAVGSGDSGALVLVGVAGTVLGIVLLGLFTQRTLLRHTAINAHRSADWARAFALYLIQIAILALAAGCLLAIWTGLGLKFWIGIGLAASLPERLSTWLFDLPNFAHLAWLGGALLNWVMMVPILWALLRCGLILPYAAMARVTSPWASWRLTRPLRGTLGWLSVWISLVFGAAAVVIQARLLPPMPQALSKTGASGDTTRTGASGDTMGSLLGNIDGLGTSMLVPQAFPTVVMIFALVHLALLVLALLGLTAALYIVTKPDSEAPLRPSRP